MGGIEFLQELRRDDSIHDTVVFVITTFDADSNRLDAYSEYIAGYIVKSEMNDGFIDAIKMLDRYWRTVVLLD